MPDKNPLIKWIMLSGVDGVGRILLQILGTIFFARLLDAEAFGLSSLTLVYGGVISILLKSVFEEALIQHRRVRKKHFSDALTAVLLMGAGFVVLINLIYATGWIKGPIADPLLATAAVFSLVFLAEGPVSIYTASARRFKQFPEVALANLLGMFTGTVVGLIMAWLGAGVWSLLAVAFIGRWVTLIVLVARSPVLILPTFDFSWPSELFVFGRWSLATRWLGALTQSLMQTLVTRYFGFEGNGLLNMAMRIVEPLRGVVIPITHNLSMTFFSRKQENPAQFRQLVVQTMSGVTLLTQPLFIGLACTATLILWVIAGKDWIDAGPLASLLALAVAIESGISLLFTGLLARGRPEVGFAFSVLNIGATLAAIVLLSPLGLIAVGLARLIAEMASLIGILGISNRLLGIDQRSVLMPLAAAWLSCGCMAVIVLASTHFSIGLSPAARLPLVIAAGVLSYAAICLSLRRDAFKSAWQALNQRGR